MPRPRHESRWTPGWTQGREASQARSVNHSRLKVTQMGKLKSSPHYPKSDLEELYFSSFSFLKLLSVILAFPWLSSLLLILILPLILLLFLGSWAERRQVDYFDLPPLLRDESIADCYNVQFILIFLTSGSQTTSVTNASFW